MTTPSAESIRAELEKSKPRILQVDPIVIAYFGDFNQSLKQIIEKRIKKIILDNQPHYTVQSKPKCDLADS